MSLVSLALRTVTTRALRGATYAVNRVYDSMVDPETLIRDEVTPAIVVAVDGSDTQVTGRDILGANAQVQLTIDLVVATKVAVPRGQGEDGEPVEMLAIAHTDAGMETTLDFMVRQIHRALLAHQSPWSTLWSKIVTSISKIQVDRGASAEDGARFATRQIILTLNTLAEPSFGPAVGVWREIIDAMTADPQLAAIAKLLEGEIETPDLNRWQRAVADLGLRDGYSVGGEALLEAPEQELTGVTIEFPGGSLDVNEQSIEDALGPDPNETEAP